jgi:hypothetical protein
MLQPQTRPCSTRAHRGIELAASDTNRRLAGRKLIPEPVLDARMHAFPIRKRFDIPTAKRLNRAGIRGTEKTREQAAGSKFFLETRHVSLQGFDHCRLSGSRVPRGVCPCLSSASTIRFLLICTSGRKLYSCFIDAHRCAPNPLLAIRKPAFGLIAAVRPPPNLPPRCAQGEGLNGATDMASAHAFVSQHRKATANTRQP